MEITYPHPLKIFVSSVVFVLLDSIWFLVAKPLYPVFSNVNIYFAPLAWISLAIGISCTVPEHLHEASIFGAFYGFVVYGVFNGTELTVNKEYRKNWYTSFADLCWGITVCTIVSTLLFYIK